MLTAFFQSIGESKHATRIAIGIIATFLIGGFIFNKMSNTAIINNNEGMSSFVAGDNQTAIAKFQQAEKGAIDDNKKLQILLNLAYAYSSENQNQNALQAFKEALALAELNTFYYFLITGEISLLEGKPDVAELNYIKAHKLSPNNFQINNALNLFYLDLEELAPEFFDYQKALSYAKKALEVSDPSVKNIAKQNLALAYYFNENYKETIILLSNDFDFNKEPYLAYWLGLAHLGNEDYEQAGKFFSIATDAGVEISSEIENLIK